MITDSKPFALDFGCGNNKFSDNRYEVIGVDANPGSGVDVLCDFDQMAALPFPDNHFQHVYMSHILEHVAEPRLLLLEAFRVAKLGCLDHGASAASFKPLGVRVKPPALL